MTDRRHLTSPAVNVSSDKGILNSAADVILNTEVNMEQTPAEPETVEAHCNISQYGQQAISLRHAFKTYGSSKNPVQVFQNLNMTVNRGSIYGLLGASGCGKTTLLSCIVGRRHLDSGEILVLGGKPGTKGSGVPGKRVGYMPQEIALFGEFTIRETMMYFGWIFDMTTNQVDEKMQFLLKFLDLPPQERLVKTLSGGQQRRVSFAAALIHDPELLILDEPTVGVDPLLRGNIWDHLVQLTKTGNKTVIITTHYIEEARQAHTIGLMRNGKLLAEDSPQGLLTMYNSPTLEEVFLKLSQNQGVENAVTQEDAPNDTNLPLSGRMKKGDALDTRNVFDDHFNPNILQSYDERNVNDSATVLNSCSFSSLNFTTTGKLKALLQKNFLRMWRNIGMMMFIFALPMIQVNLFCLSIGRDPSNLRVAVVNYEMNWENKSCYPDKWGCNYVNCLSNETIVKDYYETPELANEAVRRGDAWATLFITENFTRNLISRALSLDDTNNHSDIRVWLDMSNQQISFSLRHVFQLGFLDFAQSLKIYIPQSPVKFEDPIYGSMKTTHTSFVAPGVILTVIFFFALSLTSSTLIVERIEGLLDRSWVAGVSSGEILFSHIITQLLILCVQTVTVHVSIIFIYKVECNGDIGWIVVLSFLQGLCGMCYGFLISSICELERNAMQLSMGSFYPSILLSGIMWPVEGMPVVLRYISNILPLTLATSSLRSMMTRGWSITDFEVYMGFISTISWILFFLMMSVLVLKLKRG